MKGDFLKIASFIEEWLMELSPIDAGKGSMAANHIIFDISSFSWAQAQLSSY
jgi:hypothetical protein